MGDGHRAILAQQKQRHRLADNIRPSDHHRLLAAKVTELGT
jgi:hypothetical protein